MKKIFKLTESQLIKVVEKIIKESEYENIGDFEKIETEKATEYQFKDKNKLRFSIKFLKELQNNKYKIEIICEDNKDKMSYNLIDYFDSKLKEYEQNSTLIDSGRTYTIEYLINQDKIEAFKQKVEIIINTLKLR